MEDPSPGESPLGGVRFDSLEGLDNANEVSRGKLYWSTRDKRLLSRGRKAYLIKRFATKRSVENILRPFLVPLRCRRMPLKEPCVRVQKLKATANVRDKEH
jgi:hypothetical protein